MEMETQCLLEQSIDLQANRLSGDLIYLQKLNLKFINTKTETYNSLPV